MADIRGFDVLIGKTIKSVNTRHINVITITFTDDTKYTIDTEAVAYGLYTPVVYKAEDNE